METIIKDNQRIMSSTKQPEIYFACRKLYFETMEMMTNIDYYSQGDLNDAYAKDQGSVNAFIDRYWQACLDKIKTFQTRSEADTLLQHFYAKLDDYRYVMPVQSIEYYHLKR